MTGTQISSVYQIIISTYAYEAVVQSKTHQFFPPSTDGHPCYLIILRFAELKLIF